MVQARTARVSSRTVVETVASHEMAGKGVGIHVFSMLSP